MSANAKFWANVRLLENKHLWVYLTHSEKDDFERAIQRARKSNNVLTGIDAEASATIERLLNLAVERQKESKKSYAMNQNAFRWAR